MHVIDDCYQDSTLIIVIDKLWSLWKNSLKVRCCDCIFFFHKFKDLKFGHMYMYWYAIFLLSLCLRSGISQQRDIPNLHVIGLWTWPHSIILLWYYIKFFIKTNSVQQLIKSGLYLFTKFWLVSQLYYCVWYFFFSSPELKAQMRFSDHLSSVHPSFYNLVTSSSSPEPVCQFQTSLAQNFLW